MALVAMIISVGFTSCSSDDEPSGSPEALNAMVGTWNITKLEVKTLNNGVVDDQKVTVYDEGHETIRRIFKSNYTCEYWEEISTGQWSLVSTYKWNYSANKLILTKDSKQTVISVKLLTPDQLILEFPEEWKADYDDNGQTIRKTEVRVETFSKSN